MSLQQRPSAHGNAAETQHLKDLFNNHIGLAVADLFQHATSRNQSLDVSCHSPNHPSVISASADQRSLILSLQNQQQQQQQQPCSSPHTNQDGPSPTNHTNQKGLTVNTALGFEALQQATPAHTQAPNQAMEARSTQLSNCLVTSQDRASITPPLPVSLNLFSSISASISPVVKANPLHEEQNLSSAPGSSFSRSPQTDSSISSRQTEHSDHVTSSSGDAVKSSTANHGVSVALGGVHGLFGSRGRTYKNFELSFCPKSDSSDNLTMSSSLQTPQFQAFRDFSGVQNSQGTLGSIPKLESSTNSSPTELCHKAIFTDARRASTDPSSPHLSNPESSVPSSAAGAPPPVWSHPSLNYPITSDVYSQRVFYPTQGGMQPFPVADHNNAALKHTSTDPNKSTEPSPFALNKSSTSPSTGGWSADETNAENHCSTMASGNIPVNDNQQLFSFPPAHPSTQGPAYSHSGSLEHQYKFVDRNCLPNRNPNHTNSLGLLPPYNPQRAPYMEKIPENLVVLGEAGSTGLNKLSHHPSEETGHNAVEKRYRNNINSHIAALADLVPALQHLRSLPSAATSRRHSSQFIVSTSAIGKIPTGLVDGVKAATKLSKGNILSKSVDYMRHLLRRRTELKEDIEDLKEVIKSRVEGGELLILQWEEIVNSKSADRQRQRMLEQNQGEEDGDEDDDMNDSNNKRTGLNINHSLNPNKKRKMSDVKIGDTGKPKAGKITSKTPRKPPSAPEFSNQSLNSMKSDAFVLSSEPLPPGSNHGPFVHNAVGGRQDSLGKTTHELVDELDVLREPPTNYHHHFLTQHANTHDFNHLHTSEFSPDFMGHPFAPVPPPDPYSQQAINASSRPLLAVFMGLSFAVGSGYSYHQTWRTNQTGTETWNSPEKSKSPEGCPLSTVPSSLQGFNCHHEANPGRSHCLISSPPAPGIHHGSITQAGLNTMSIASIIWTLILIFKPEFILNYCSSGRLKRSKEKLKCKGQTIFENFRLDSNESTDYEGASKETSFYGDHKNLQNQKSLIRGDDDEQIILGCSQKPGRMQYDRLCELTACPNNWRSVIFELSKEVARTTIILIWGETFKKISGFEGNKRGGKRARMKQIKIVLAWVRITEIESSWDFGRTSFLKRLHSIFKLYNLYRDLDWRDRVIKEELDPGKISAILALSVKNLFGDSNRVSQSLWRKAIEAHQNDQIAFKSVKTSVSILPACYYRPSFHRVTEESWLNESLMLGYEDACELLAGKGEQYRLMSADVGEFGGNRGWSPLKQIVETRAELELIEIWSRIFVSMITKTCPVEKTSRDVCITERHFGLDGGLAELPTRLEEAGAPYALQVSQGRRKVEQSIERICRLRLGSSSAVGRMARVTRGMWAMAFGKRELAVKVGEELKREGKEDDEILCIGPFLELVLGTRIVIKPSEQRVNSTLDKLAKMTIDWLLIRREHILLNVMKTPSKRIATENHESKKRLLAMKCKELKSILAMGMIESERNRELNARSTKQTDEAIQAGEAREFDLRTAIEECQRSVVVIENYSHQLK